MMSVEIKIIPPWMLLLLGLLMAILLSGCGGGIKEGERAEFGNFTIVNQALNKFRM